MGRGGLILTEYMHEQSTNHISPKIGLDVTQSHPLPAQDVFWSMSGLHGACMAFNADINPDICMNNQRTTSPLK